MFDISHLLLISLFFTLYIYWSSSQQVKEEAFRATRAYCEKMEVQMLDGYVALDKLRLKRDERGHIRVWRSFAFEFTSTGEQRYNGHICMLGYKAVAIQMDPYRIDSP